jgi:hypothetical protein
MTLGINYSQHNDTRQNASKHWHSAYSAYSAYNDIQHKNTRQNDSQITKGITAVTMTTLGINNSYHNSTQLKLHVRPAKCHADFHYADCPHAECHYVVILRVVAPPGLGC